MPADGDPEIFMAVTEGHIHITRRTRLRSVSVEFRRSDASDETVSVALNLSYQEFLDLCNARALMLPPDAR